MKTILSLLFVVILVSGCGTYGKKVDVKLDFVYNITTTGAVTISPTVDQKSLTGDIRDLKTDNRPDIPVKLEFPKPADILQQSIEGAVDSKILKKAEEIIVPPVEPPAEPSTDQKITLQKAIDSERKFNWLPVSGASIDSAIDVEFPECDYTLHVPNSRYAWGADGDASNYNQSYYFSGNPDLQKDINNSCPGGCASIFAPPACTQATYALVRAK